MSEGGVHLAHLDPVDPGAAPPATPLGLDVLEAPSRVHRPADPALPRPPVREPDDGGAFHSQNPLSLHPALQRPDVELFLVLFLHLSKRSLAAWTNCEVNRR